MILLFLACTNPGPIEKAPIDSGAPTTPDTSPTDSGPADSATDAPCETDPAQPGEDITLSMEWEGRPRTWNVHLPVGYDCTPTPVVIGLHYYTGTAENFEHEVAQIHDWLDEHKVIGIFPNAMARGEGPDDNWITAFNDVSSHNDDGPDGATCTSWAVDYGVFADCPASEADRACFWGTSCADDVGLVRAIIEQTSATWTVDPNRIHLTGFSQGAIATQTWAYELQDILASVAPLHGFAANGHTTAPTGDVSLMQVWGTYDYFINGWDTTSADGLIYDGAEETAEVWAEAQGCSPVGDTPYPTVADDKWGWRCTEHAGCATGTAVVQCQWDWTHDWGRDGADNFMWDAVWEFFASHPRP
jgi:poly(3-hydroxybutyrate) depolymerase